VQAFLNARSAKGLSPRTVQYIRAILRRALGQPLKWGLVRRNAAALIEFTKDDRLGPLFQVAVVSGLRHGVLFALRWEDVDLDAGTLTVRYTLQRINGKPQFMELKTPLSRRTVTLPPVAVSALKVQRRRQLEARLLVGDGWKDWNLVFASAIGTPLEPSNVIHRLQHLLVEAGLPRQRFHDLRHCAASLLLAGGVAPRTIIGILGHSQISLTMNTYAHLSPSLEREAARALDQLLTATE
jgi:integrase